MPLDDAQPGALPVALALLFIRLLGPGPAAACTPVGGWITTDTTWDIAGSPYCVYVNVHVREGATLTIDPGVEVRFDANQSLIVDNSTVAAVGTPDSTIVFTRNTSARWGAICGFFATMTFRHCRVEWGSRQDYVTLHEGLISNALGTTIVEDCILTRSGVDATEFQGGNLIFRRNLLTHLGRQGVNCWDHCRSTVVDNRVFDCNEDAYKFDSLNQAELVFHNNVVHDGRDDGLDMDHMGAVRISSFEAYNVNDKGISVSRNSGRMEGDFTVIVENAVISGANEGYVATAHSALTVFNSVAYNCRAASFSAYERYTWAGGADVYVANSIGWNAPAPVYHDSISTVTVWCSILDCDPAYPGSPPNSNADPRFVDAPGYIFSLTDDSPAIDAGFSDSMPEHDFLGRPRFDVPYVPDTGFPPVRYYDIGAFEYYPQETAVALAPPARFDLTVFPSPAAGPVAVAFDLPERSDVSLAVYDPAGRLIARLYSGSLERGPQRMTWRADPRLPRGVYLVKLEAGGEEAIRKVVRGR